jgi:DNA-binding LacI/PurR family transcriptional regulator
MASLKSLAEQAGVPILTAFQALNNDPGVDPATAERVREIAGVQGYAPRSTIRDVAALAEVSVSTVSYVINDSPLIHPRTSDKVRAAIKLLGYRPNRTARNLKASETRLIGYAWYQIQDMSQRNQVLDRFLYEMAQASESQGYHVLTFAQSAPHGEESYTELIQTSRVDGFVLSDTTYDDPRIHRLLELDIPFACFGRATPEWEFPYADDDGLRGLALVIEHLIEQGHRRIAMIGWPKGSAVVGDIRVQGYLEAVKAHGIEPEPDLLVRTHNDVRHAAQAAHDILSRTPRPTAIACGSDIIAVGVRMYLEQAGLRLGHDVAVASYDDTPVAEVLGLTSVHQQLDTIAQEVVRLLIGRIRGTPPAEQHVLVAPRLVVRASSDPAMKLGLSYSRPGDAG